MKTMISELVVNTEVMSFFFIPEAPQVKKNKRGIDYLCLKLQDKTGIVDGRVWDIPPGLEVLEIKQGSFVKIRGQVSEWNEQTQISVSQLRLAEEADSVEQGDFFERSEQDPKDMLTDLRHSIGIQLVDGPVKELLFKVLRDNEERLLLAPAAKSVHHNFIGGLLEHVLSMFGIAIEICEHYGLNKDLVVAACVLHDIGKIKELTFPVGIGYSVEGTLIGHISIGMEMVSRAMDDVDGFPPEKKMAILHMIASHHGLLEYGSPKVPMMREAVAFHLIDMLDSRVAICNKAIKKGISDEGLTEWVKELGGPLYVMKE